MNVVARESPLARWILYVLRDRSTPQRLFREYMEAAGSLLAPYIAKGMEWIEREVATPLGHAVEMVPKYKPLAVGILGAAVPLVAGFARVMPDVDVGFIAARRIEAEDSVRVEVYYDRLPERVLPGNVVLLDPMLATGSTAAASLRLLSSRGARRVILGAVIAAPEGVSRVGREAEDLGVEASLYTLALDPGLDSRFFIVPGLGDAGDRALG